MRCRSVLTRVDALRTGELPAEERGVVREHLRSCPSCDESLTDVGMLAGVVKALAAVPPRSCRETLADSYELLRDGDEPVWVVFSEKGLRLIHRGGTLGELRSTVCSRFGRSLVAGTMPDALRAQVDAALEGKGVKKPRVDWEPAAGEFEREVLSALTRIPKGEVRTYEWVARQAGKPRAVRAAASIVARNAVPFVVPCHRVVPATGGVGNYAFGSAVKREMLRREGVDVEQLEALGRSHVRYIGSKTTKIVCFPTCGDAMRIREENRVPFRDAGEATERGFRPCLRCQPFAA